MRAAIAFLLLTAAAARAVPIPGYAGVQVQAFSTGTGYAADELRCARVVQGYDVSSATNLAGAITAAVSGGTCGFSIYPDSDGGTQLAEVSGSCSSAGIVSGSVSSFSMTRGTIYRVCACSSATSTTGGYLSIADTALGTGHLADLLTEFSSTVIGTAANSCSTGNPPSTTGAITGATIGTDDFRIPLLWAE